MASILLCCTPAHGHVYPLLTVGRDLAARGHDVRMLTGSPYRSAVEAAGLRFLPLPPEADLDVDHPNEVHPERATMRPIAQLKFSVTAFFVRTIGPQVRALDAAIAGERTDVVLGEMLFLGAAVLARRPRATRPAVVTLGIFPLAVGDPDVAPYGFGIPPLRGAVGRLRNRLLQRVADRVFASVLTAGAQEVAVVEGGDPPRFDLADLPAASDLVLQLTVRGFEYPRRTLPPNVRFVGPVLRPGTAEALPDWWADLEGRTVVHVSQGTAANDDPTALILPTLAALADDDVLVVVSTGGRPVDALGPLPSNARAAEYLPYESLFQRIAVFVTNGGYGGLHFALRASVPIVAAGTSEDKLETTARVQWSGAGIRLRSDRPKPAAIRRAVRRALLDPRYRDAAARLQAEIAASPGLDGIAAAIDELTIS